MIIERARAGLALVLLATLAGAAPCARGANDTLSLAYLERSEDPFYAPHRAYTGLSLRDRHRPLEGARTGLRDARVLARAIGLELRLLERSLGPKESAVEVVRELARTEGVGAFLLDLPIEDVTGLAAALADDDLVLFNIRHRDDRLRAEGCSPVLFHTLPSEAMAMDAMAQFLRKKGWRAVLALEGEEEADRRLSEAFQRSARKFGLSVVDVRRFLLGNDPRERDQNNIALLTTGGGYDVVFIADSFGEFGRYVPYSTQSARPVIGTEGLIASAWHWTFERHGAPQLNQRFTKTAGRRMEPADYAAWAAVKALLEAVTRTRSTDITALRTFMSSEDFAFDTYKGVRGSFRPWDHQLRQVVLLHTYDATIATAPLEGFLHEKNDLDTLGPDERESACRLRG